MLKTGQRKTIMPLLLDTCILLWMAADPKRISGTARQAIQDNRDELYASAISAFEVAIKHKKNKLQLPLDPWPWFQQTTETFGIQEAPISARIAALAPEVQAPHADPADRIIVATAITNNLQLISPDHLIHECPQIKAIW